MKFHLVFLVMLLILGLVVIPAQAQPGSDGLCRDAAGAVIPCPDGDGDGVPDHLDVCPTTAGTAANNGCPETVPQPTQPAPADRDGDGITDDQDQCPDLAGDTANMGCLPPEPTADPAANPLPALPAEGECVVGTRTSQNVNIRALPRLDAAAESRLTPDQIVPVLGIVTLPDGSRWFLIEAGFVAGAVVRVGGACDTTEHLLDIKADDGTEVGLLLPAVQKVREAAARMSASAADSTMPQTREHILLARQVGTPSGIPTQLLVIFDPLMGLAVQLDPVDPDYPLLLITPEGTPFQPGTENPEMPAAGIFVYRLPDGGFGISDDLTAPVEEREPFITITDLAGAPMIDFAPGWLNIDTIAAPAPDTSCQSYSSIFEAYQYHNYIIFGTLEGEPVNPGTEITVEVKHLTGPDMEKLVIQLFRVNPDIWYGYDIFGGLEFELPGSTVYTITEPGNYYIYLIITFGTVGEPTLIEVNAYCGNITPG